MSIVESLIVSGAFRAFVIGLLYWGNRLNTQATEMKLRAVLDRIAVHMAPRFAIAEFVRVTGS